MNDGTFGNRIEARESTATAGAGGSRDWVLGTYAQLTVDANRVQGALRALSVLLEERDTDANLPAPADLGCLVAVMTEHMSMVVDNIAAIEKHV